VMGRWGEGVRKGDGRREGEGDGGREKRGHGGEGGAEEVVGRTWTACWLLERR